MTHVQYNAAYRAVTHRAVTYGLIIVGALLATGCHSDSLAPVRRDAENVFWRLSLNYHAMVLSTQAPHNTAQLIATPLNIFGDTLSGAPAVTFFKLSPQDTTFTLSESGLVTAKSENARAAIIARVTIDGITLADTSYMMVRTGAAAIPLTSFSIQPEVPDSNWMWSVQVAGSFVYPSTKQVQAIATDNASQVLSNDDLIVAIWSENSEVIKRYNELDQGVFYASPLGDTGSVMIHAEVYYYGTLWTDSTRLYVIPPPITVVQIATIEPLTGPTYREIQPATLTIPAGTTVQWINDSPAKQSAYRINDLSFLYGDPLWPVVQASLGSYATLRSGDSVDIVFDHPELIDPGSVWFAEEPVQVGGNISAWAQGTCEFEKLVSCATYFSSADYPQLQADVSSRTRSFPVPGTYHYHSVRHPALSGTVIVTDSLKVPPPTGH